jgi:3-oxoacyl-[acyl-carrier-protein] synthase II
VGEGADAVFRALCAGTSGRAELRGFDGSRYRAQHAYEIDDRPAEGADVPGRATAWLLRAIREAAAQAGLGEDLSGVPILVGTGLRELRSAELAWRDAAARHSGALGTAAVAPTAVDAAADASGAAPTADAVAALSPAADVPPLGPPAADAGIAEGLPSGAMLFDADRLSCDADRLPFDADRLHFGTALRERFGADLTYTFAGACSASLYALAMGSDLLAAGLHDTVVVAGVDTLTESMYGLLDRVNADPPDRVLPFDRERRGVLMGDGAAAVVLRRERPEELPGALGRLRAVSVNCDARHVTAPDPKGIAEAVREAQRRAGVKPRDVDLVLLHGTGTLLNDGAEATAIGEVFGPDVRVPLMTAIKSMTGHTSGGSGLLSLIVALKALSSGRVPPVVGLTEPADEAAVFRFVREPVAGAELGVAQVDAFGFGGVNAVAIVERTGR